MTRVRDVFVVALAVCLWAPLSHAQVDVGNGGDSIDCHADSNSRFEGAYALDYLLTYRASNDNADIVPAQSWQSSLARIAGILNTKAPKLGRSLSAFAALVKNTDPRRDRVWREAPFGLVKLDDQSIVEHVPPNCMSHNEVMVVQAVIRLSPGISGLPPPKLAYSYVPRVFDQLEAQAPVQLSFLLVHEWLWDLSMNVVANRQINRFLHSSELDDLSAEEIVSRLEAYGIDTELRPRIILKANEFGVCASVGDRLDCWGTGFVDQQRTFSGLRDFDLSLTDFCAHSDQGIECVTKRNPIFPPALDNPTALAVGFQGACALDGTEVKCFGDGRFQVKVPEGTQAELISARAFGVCLAHKGMLQCPDFFVGDRVATIPSPFRVPALSDVDAIEMGDRHVCVLKQGQVECFGENGQGQAQAPRLGNAVSLSLGVSHSCALTQDRRLVCWGNRAAFTPMPALDRPFAVAAGENFTCVADRQGIKCFGSNQPIDDVPEHLRHW